MVESNEMFHRIAEDLADIKVTMAKNTASLEEHMRRTENIEEKLAPVYENYIKESAVKEYKEAFKVKTVQYLKLPALIVAAITAIVTLISYLKG